MAIVNLEDFVVGEIGGVKILDADRILENDEAVIHGDIDPLSDAGYAQFRSWCKAKNITYYGAEGYEFNETDALNRALDNGSTYIVMEVW